MDQLYYPNDSYTPWPGTVFAVWNQGPRKPPNPCRKYHVSADLGSAAGVAAVTLPILRSLRLYHKVVQCESDLKAMQRGDQAGKFITIYAPTNFTDATLVDGLGGALAKAGNLRPSPTVPRARQYKHVFIERPLDEGMFIYGGYETDPTA